MKRHWHVVCRSRVASLLLVAFAMTATAQGAIGLESRTRHASRVFFEETSGQAAEPVRFITRGTGYVLYVTDNGAVAFLRNRHGEQQRVRVQLISANPHPILAGEDPLRSKSNYFIGNDPAKWRKNVVQYARVRAAEVYRGIDVVYYGGDNGLEYDFVVKPGGDVSRIRLHYDGVVRSEVDHEGDLVLHLKDGELRQRLPVVYQEIGGTRRVVRARYRRLNVNEFGISVAAFDATRPLVIDPVLSYSTYLGGSDSDAAFGIAADGAGNVYVTGFTYSVDFPTTAGSLRTTKRSGSIIGFVTKFDASGAPVYSTFLGGTDHTEAYAVAVDSAGNAYVTGMTFDHDFPIANAPQPTFQGLNDAFITKLNASGSAIVYSTFLGGDISQAGYGIAVDTTGSALVTGDTNSTNFPTVNALQSSIPGSINSAFVAKVNPAGSTFAYVTLLGGAGYSRGVGAAEDAAGNGYIAGVTNAANFPVTPGAFQTVYGGIEDGFVVKINPAGSALVYSTYLGGSSVDTPLGIAVDSSGQAVVVGSTFSADFPLVHPVQPSYATGFISKLSGQGSSLIYSTYLGGTHGVGSDAPRSVALDSGGNVYVTGGAGSVDFPVVNAIQPTSGGSVDAFVTALNASGSAFLYSTYLGGSALDSGSAVCVDKNGRAVVAGSTGSTNFPVVNAFQPHFAGGSADAFVTAIGVPDLTIAKNHAGNFLEGQTGATYTITVSNAGPAQTAGLVSVTDTLPTTLVAAAMSGNGWSCTLATLTCTRSDALAAGSSYPPITLTVNVPATTIGTVVNVASVAGGGEVNTSNDSASDVTTVQWNPNIPTLDPRALAALALVLAVIAVHVLRK